MRVRIINRSERTWPYTVHWGWDVVPTVTLCGVRQTGSNLRILDDGDDEERVVTCKRCLKSKKLKGGKA